MKIKTSTSETYHIQVKLKKKFDRKVRVPGPATLSVQISLKGMYTVHCTTTQQYSIRATYPTDDVKGKEQQGTLSLGQ